MPRASLFAALILGNVWAAAASQIGTASACQVPVFRYALERWTPDRYQVLVLSSGPLPMEMEEWLKPLQTHEGFAPPVDLSIVDVASSDDPVAQAQWDQYSADGKAPLLVIQYPRRFGASDPAFVAKLTESSIRSILDSPVRKEIIRRLSSGHSAVWVLLMSGDAAKDAQAMEKLETQLSRDAERLELPTSEELEVEETVLGKAKVPLQIKFSVVSLDRRDPAEKFLIDCLIGSESDLEDYDKEPIAFPVFGRGIVLYALVGDGISGEVVASASKFIVGPCSCQVKEQNPGFDLLLNCDWESIVGNTLISSPVPASDSAPRLLTIPPGKTKK